MKVTVLVVIGLLIIVLFLIRYLIKQNQKDRKELKDYLTNDYPKPKDSEPNDEEC